MEVSRSNQKRKSQPKKYMKSYNFCTDAALSSQSILSEIDSFSKSILGLDIIDSKSSFYMLRLSIS